MKPLEEMTRAELIAELRRREQLEGAASEPDSAEQPGAEGSSEPLRNARRTHGEPGQRVKSLKQRIGELTEQRDAALRELKDADRRISEFLGVFSHELRNPLAGIANGLAILEYGTTPSGDASQALRIMQRQLRNATRLVDDLLDVTRVAQGKLEVQCVLTNLPDLVENALAASESFLSQRKHRLAFSRPDEVLAVYCDPARIEQVLVHLLHNASKHSDAGSEIRVDIARVDGYVEVQVTDHGEGMSREQLQSAFELFPQTRSAERAASGGLGIGLALVKELVELHGGSVDARSAGPGQGNTFLIRLPLRDARLLAPAATQPEPVDRRSNTQRILVIEDDEDTAQLLSQLLGKWGYHVSVAYSGTEGLEMAENLRPEIVLLDIALPGMNGYAVAETLQKMPSACRPVLIAVSGYCSPSDRRRAADAGIHYYLAKPVAAAELRMILASHR